MISMTTKSIYKVKKIKKMKMMTMMMRIVAVEGAITRGYTKQTVTN